MKCDYPYLINMQIPVGSMALDIPFHDAIIEYFCFAVRGSRGSVGAGGAPLRSAVPPPPPLSLAASLPNSHPIPRMASHLCKNPFFFLLSSCDDCTGRIPGPHSIQSVFF